MLHVSSIPTGHTPKRLHKVQVLLDVLIANFKGNMHPSANLSVDETMIGFRGRFGTKQYIPNKPNKYGIKAFTLADSANGYVLENCIHWNLYEKPPANSSSISPENLPSFR